MLRTPFQKLVMVVSVLAAVGCGRAPQSASDLKIVGGTPVASGAFPGIVGVAVGKAGEPLFTAICTGTLIAPAVVLTAGHCVEGPDDVVVFTGDGEDDAKIAVAAAHAVRAKAVHASLRRYPLGYADFAVLTLAEPLSDATPYPLVQTLADRLAAERRGTALLVGYGRREDGRAGRKFQAEAKIQSVTAAEAVIGGEGKDACAGDSGGPALTKRDDGTYQLLGVVSRGVGLDCGKGGYVGMTSDVACWIAEAAGLPAPRDCGLAAPAYGDAELARADFLRLCSAKNARPTQRDTIRKVMAGLGLTSCREAAATLASAKTLALDGLLLVDLSPLARLANLEELSLTANRIRDLSPLRGLAGLKTLRIDANDVDATDALAALEEGGLVVFGKRRQRANFFQTDFLRLCRDESTSEAARATIKAVFWSTLAETCDKANERLLALSTLRLGDRELTDLAPLAGLAGLRTLDVSRNPLAGIEPLASLENLQKLNLAGTGVTDVSSLAPLVARGLVITGTTP